MRIRLRGLFVSNCACSDLKAQPLESFWKRDWIECLLISFRAATDDELNQHLEETFFLSDLSTGIFFFENSIWRLGISLSHTLSLGLLKYACARNLFHVIVRPWAFCSSLSLPVKRDTLLTVLLKSHVITTFRGILDFTTRSKSFEKLTLVSVILSLV